MVVAVSSLFSINARAVDFFVMPELGYGHISFNEGYTLEDFDDSSNFNEIKCVLGMSFESNIVVGGGVSSAGNFQFYGANDHYSVFQYMGLLGYSFDLAPKLKIMPMIGVSSWRLTLEEGAFLNPGPEETLEKDGADYFGRINFEVPMTDLFQLNFSYHAGAYDFGDLHSFSVGGKFTF